MKQSDSLKLDIDNLISSLSKESAISVLNTLQRSEPFPLVDRLSEKMLSDKQTIFTKITTVLEQKSPLSSDDFAAETDTKEIVIAYIKEKLQDLAKLPNNDQLRPYYPEEWKNFEKTANLTDKESIKKIDRIRQQQIDQNKPYNWFYREMFKEYGDGSKTNLQFSLIFKYTTRWFKYEKEAAFDADFLELIDSHIKTVEDDLSVPEITSFRIIYNTLKLFEDGKRVDIYKKYFPNEAKWFDCENELNNLREISPENLNIINRALQEMSSGSIYEDDFIKKMNNPERGPKLLQEQKAVIQTYYPESLKTLDRDVAITPRKDHANRTADKKTHSSKKSKKSNTKKTLDEDTTTTSSKVSKRKKEKETKVSHEKKLKKQPENRSRNEKIYALIYAAAEKYFARFGKSHNDTRRSQLTTQTVDGKNYLTHIIQITPPDEYTTDEEREQFANEVMQELHSIVSPLSWNTKNIFQVTKDDSWKENNKYEKKTALTIPENSPVGTVVVRLTTAVTLWEKLNKNAQTSLNAPPLTQSLADTPLNTCLDLSNDTMTTTTTTTLTISSSSTTSNTTTTTPTASSSFPPKAPVEDLSALYDLYSLDLVTPAIPTTAPEPTTPSKNTKELTQQSSSNLQEEQKIKEQIIAALKKYSKSNHDEIKVIVVSPYKNEKTIKENTSKYIKDCLGYKSSDKGVSILGSDVIVAGIWVEKLMQQFQAELSPKKENSPEQKKQTSNSPPKPSNANTFFAPPLPPRKQYDENNNNHSSHDEFKQRSNGNHGTKTDIVLTKRQKLIAQIKEKEQNILKLDAELGNMHKTGNSFQ